MARPSAEDIREVAAGKGSARDRAEVRAYRRKHHKRSSKSRKRRAGSVRNR